MTDDPSAPSPAAGASLPPRATRRAAVRHVAPLLLGVAPFGIVAGAAAVDAGLSPAHASGFSVVVFAGAAQLAAIDLIGDGSSIAVAVITALVINLRMLLYSASLAPWMATESRRARLGAAYLLTDQAYALSLARYEAEPAEHRLRYYSTVALTLWGTWQLTTIVGAQVGDAVPDDVPLEFAVPLTFLALLVLILRDRPSVVAALVAGVGAVSLSGLPANAGLFIGIVAGIVAGVVAQLRAAGR